MRLLPVTAAFTDAIAFFIVAVAFAAASFASVADDFDARAHVRELCVLPVAESKSDTPSGDDVDTAHAFALVSDAFAFVSDVFAAVCDDEADEADEAAFVSLVFAAVCDADAAL